MPKRIIIAMLVAAMAAAMPLAAQEEGDSSRVDFHMSMGATAAAGFGRGDVLAWAAPHIEWRATDRLTVYGGIAMAGSLMPRGYELHGLHSNDLAPRRHGTQIGAVWAAADYAVSDRLHIWGSLLHVSGYAQPLWLDGAMPIETTVFSGGFAYALSENSFIEMHIHLAHDHYGYMLHPPYGHGYYGPLAPTWEIYGGPWPF